MNLLEPFGLLALALAPVVLVLHLLRGSRQRRVVPSVTLWRGAARQVTARAGWRRPPLGVLLLLQLAFLLIGSLALARPALPAGPADHLIVVLDGSASMQAIDPGQTHTRFEIARQRAASLLEQVQPGADVTLIRAAASADVLASTSDRASLTDALSTAAPDSLAADMPAALALAADLANQHPRATNQVVVVSDGAYPPLDGVELGTLAVRFVAVGNSGENQAVSDVSARRSSFGGETLEGFARIVNFADHPVEANVEAAADGVPLAPRRVSLAARSQVGQTFSLPPSTRRFGVRLGPGDALALDDAAEVDVQAGSRTTALLVAAQPHPLETALRALPGWDVSVVTPQAYTTASPADLVVFDDFLPPSLPAAPVLIVDPPPGSPLLSVAGQIDGVEATDLDRASPLLAGVDADAVRFGGPSVDALPSWAQSVAAAGTTQLIFSGQLNGQRVAALAVDPRLDGLARANAFPLLVANTVDWLAVRNVRVAPPIDVTPQPHPELTRAGAAPPAEGVPREVWPLLAVLVVAVCGCEWWYDARHG